MNRLTKDELAEWICSNQIILYRFALSIVRNRTDAEDVVCEAIVRAFEHMNDLRDSEKLKSWMMSIVANIAKTLYRKRMREITVYEIPEYGGYHAEDYKREIWDCVMNLSEPQKKVFVLFFYSGYSIKEISELLDIREGTVKSRLVRARQKIKEMIQVK